MAIDEYEGKYVVVVDLRDKVYEGYTWESCRRIFLKEKGVEIKALLIEDIYTGECVQVREDRIKSIEVATPQTEKRFNLIEFEGKDVRILTKSNKIFEGYACDYIYPEDNAPVEVEGIVLSVQVNKHREYIEFHEFKIETIEIMQSSKKEKGA